MYMYNLAIYHSSSFPDFMDQFRIFVFIYPCPMGMNLDAGAHPGPMGNQSPHAPPLPQPTTPPSGGRVGRCTYGWPLPCLLDYCSAGPQVAAAAPPYFPPLWLGSWHLGCFWLGGGGALRLVCQVLEDFPSSGTVGHHKKTTDSPFDALFPLM